MIDSALLCELDQFREIISDRLPELVVGKPGKGTLSFLLKQGLGDRKELGRLFFGQEMTGVL